MILETFYNYFGIFADWLRNKNQEQIFVCS